MSGNFKELYKKLFTQNYIKCFITHYFDGLVFVNQ